MSEVAGLSQDVNQTQGANAAQGESAHRWGAVFVADCGARGRMRIAPDEARVTCPACLAKPADPARWAARDQFAASMRDAIR